MYILCDDPLMGSLHYRGANDGVGMTPLRM
jgi:hypothetical protein